MSLNWKEIDLILEELRLPGCQIQKVVQSAYDVLCLRLYGRDGPKTLLIALTPGACRLHETALARPPKSGRPLRFAEFLNARIVNRRIDEAVQLGDNRIVRITAGPYRLYVRLWSNAANVIVTDEAGMVLDAMRRLPRRGEVSGGVYRPEEAAPGAGPAEAAVGAGGVDRQSRRAHECVVRDLPGEGSFNLRIDAFYTAHGGALSLEALRERARKRFETSAARLEASLERLREKEADYADGERFREYGDLILANLSAIRPGDEWFETPNFFRGGETARIRLDLGAGAGKKPADAAAEFFKKYRKARDGLDEVRAEIAAGERELGRLAAERDRALAETNPLALNRLLRAGAGERGAAAAGGRPGQPGRPGLAFRRGDWLILVGRDAAENDALLRRHVRGNDLWLHTRDWPGAYVFVKARAGKTVPLDILLDAGSLALFYSKARGAAEADLFYTHVKYLRRAKDAPRGTVLPTQEKNLRVRADAARLRSLESARV